MQSKRVFKTKTFDRWAKKLINDRWLCQAAQEIMQGLYEADLGGGVCKKRIALPGIIAKGLHTTTAEQWEQLKQDGVLKEICHG